MADYFALLGERRRPYLEPERITATFRELSRNQHPDQAGAGGDGKDAEFVRLNQAQQTLRDPKLRLGYLIGLEYPEVKLTGPSDVPRELAGLFAPTLALIEKVNAILGRKAAAPSALARALLSREELQLREEVEGQFQMLEQLHTAALRDLEAYDAAWRPGSGFSPAALVGFYQKFAYLSRWLDQLREPLFQLGQ